MGNATTTGSGLRSRLDSMLRLDFYRLIHTPALYVMLAISAIIPAMLLTMTGADMTGTMPPGTSQPPTPSVEYTNTWQLIETAGQSAADPLDFSGYANVNMVFIFAGLLMAIFVAHDYMSGFVKAIFTTHSKKVDYVTSKTAVGVVGGAAMILAYTLGAVIAGLIAGKSFAVDAGSLVLCLLSKAFLMGVFCALFLGVAVFFRARLWLTVIFTFLFGMMLYPAASVATLHSTILTVLASLLAGVLGTAALGAISTVILSRRDLA
jgi:hypothetical protein